MDDDMNDPIGKMMMPGSTHPTYSGDLKGNSLFLSFPILKREA